LPSTPIKSESTGDVVDVEPGEAEWNLDTLEGLFDHYFVQPALLAEKRDKLNAKLADAGKPQLRTVPKRTGRREGKRRLSPAGRTGRGWRSREPNRNLVASQPHFAHGRSCEGRGFERDIAHP
jgi:hypothetical protein